MNLPVVAIVGLGYVGLPLAMEFSKIYNTIGFDVADSKISSYKKFIDPTGEVSELQLKKAIKYNGLLVTSDQESLSNADFIIVAVPTPVNMAHVPDFTALINASITVGKNMKAGATIIYESTVYPGATEEICIPVLEGASKLKWKKDFNVG